VVLIGVASQILESCARAHLTRGPNYQSAGHLRSKKSQV
jgi:hypothetical protein